jgi:DNA-binding MarR family transcriptional regulator
LDPIAEARRQWDVHGLDATLEMSAATSITRLHQLVVGAINAVLKPLDLTFARYEALQLLAFSRRGELPLGKMGSRLMVHPTSVTNAIDRLESAGLVERVPHPTDRRTTLARITDRGVERVEEATRALIAARFGLTGVDASVLEDLDNAAARVRAVLDSAPAPPA